MNWIKKLFSKKNLYEFIYPYSDNSLTKKFELIQNLENGILFEDLNLFVKWNEPFKNLESHVKKKKGDKSYEDSGKHKVLDGIEINLNPHKNMSNLTPFIGIDSFLGFDEEGHQKYIELKNKIVERFGLPDENLDSLPYDFYGDKTLYWIFNGSQISLSVWERFAVHYSLNIGVRYSEG